MDGAAVYHMSATANGRTAGAVRWRQDPSALLRLDVTPHLPAFSALTPRTCRNAPCIYNRDAFAGVVTGLLTYRGLLLFT